MRLGYLHHGVGGQRIQRVPGPGSSEHDPLREMDGPLRGTGLALHGTDGPLRGAGDPLRETGDLLQGTRRPLRGTDGATEERAIRSAEQETRFAERVVARADRI